MINGLISIPLDNFNLEIYRKVLSIYEETTGVRALPTPEETDIQSIVKDLDELFYCEFRFGSSISHHSKLFIHLIRKKDILRISFDFDPNTSDDSRSQAVAMRSDFQEKISSYLTSLN